MGKYFISLVAIFSMLGGCIVEADCPESDSSDASCFEGQSYCISESVGMYCTGAVPGTWGEWDCAYACRAEGGGCCGALMNGSGQDGCLCADDCIALGYHVYN